MTGSSPRANRPKLPSSPSSAASSSSPTPCSGQASPGKVPALLDMQHGRSLLSQGRRVHPIGFNPASICVRSGSWTGNKNYESRATQSPIAKLVVSVCQYPQDRNIPPSQRGPFEQPYECFLRLG